jgi:hypothetical protein
LVIKTICYCISFRVTNITEVSIGHERRRGYENIIQCVLSGIFIVRWWNIHEKFNTRFIERMKFEVRYFVSSDMLPFLPGQSDFSATFTINNNLIQMF